MKSFIIVTSENPEHFLLTRLNVRLLPVAFLFVYALFCAPMLHADSRCIEIMDMNTSRAGAFTYLGPAVKEMLVTRLAAEEVIVVKDRSRVDSGGCFLLSGEIISTGENNIAIGLHLSGQDGKNTLHDWSIIPENLDTLLPAISSCSIELADYVEEFSISPPEAEKVHLESAISDEAPVLHDESLVVAKMHPDKMLYEKHVEITPASEAIGAEDATYDASQDVTTTGQTGKSGDNEVYDSIQHDKGEAETVYLNSRQELPYAPPAPLPTVPADNGAIKKSRQDDKSVKNENDSGWLSWLWPWSDEDEETEELLHRSDSIRHETVQSEMSGSEQHDASAAKSVSSVPTRQDMPIWRWN